MVRQYLYAEPHHKTQTAYLVFQIDGGTGFRDGDYVWTGMDSAADSVSYQFWSCNADGVSKGNSDQPGLLYVSYAASEQLYRAADTA